MTSFLDFRAAVHLNNTAVSLLEKKCYRQAMETFCSAIAVMKSSMTNREANKDHQMLDTGAIEAKLQQAAQRLANPERSNARMNHNMNIHVMSDDESALAKCSHALPRDLVAIRIDPQDMNFEQDRCFVEASICLFNYAQCYRCLSLLETTPDVETLRVGAYKITSLALDILSEDESLFDQSLECVAEVWNGTNREIYMASISLQSLIELAPSHEEAIHYRQRLLRLQSILHGLLALDFHCQGSAAGAA